REMIEVSNVWCRDGHQVTIYHPDGKDIKWISSLALTKKTSFLQTDHLDVLIGIIDWKPDMYNYLEIANAKVKAICLMGFTPTQEMADALKGQKTPAGHAEKIIRDAIN